jgi:hypothetical protein
MRKTLGLLIVVMLFAVGSSTALAATRQNMSIRALIAEAGWESYNEDTGAGEFGDVLFATADGATTVSVGISKGELVLCEGGDTPDESDDFYGFVGTETTGEGDATLSLGKTFRSAIAKGTVTADVFTYDECTGDEGTTTTKTFDVSLSLDGVSPIVTEKSRSTITIPKQLRSKTMVQARSREAAGTLKVGTRSIDVGGFIGLLSMKGFLKER